PRPPACPLFPSTTLFRSLIGFSECYPDLIMCLDGPSGPELRVVDVKASNWMKLSHRIQVGVYTLILREVLRAAGIETTVARTGGDRKSTRLNSSHVKISY